MDFLNQLPYLSAAFCVFAYLVGSIPSSVWVGKTFYGIDVRDHGSGNAGATNTFRVLGKKPGIIVLLMDILKGYTAASLVYLIPYISEIHLDTYLIVNFKLGFGFCAVIGHLVPLFANFKGGKGVATLGGLIIAMDWIVALIAIGIFLLALFVTRFVSLGSMLGGISVPVLFVSIFGANHLEYRQPSVVIFTVIIAILVVYTHRKNINRLIQGNENKANLLPKHRKG